MTARSMLLKVRDATGGRCRNTVLAARVGLLPSEISKIISGKRQDGMRVATLASISDHTGLHIGLLATWWAEPEEHPPCLQPRKEVP